MFECQYNDEMEAEVKRLEAEMRAANAGHMCELESQQEWDTMRLITDKPKVKCENCGAEANSSRNVCMPAEL